MKLIKDNSLTPIESARLKYQRLYEEQILFKENRKELLQNSFKNLIFNFLKITN
jgi:hypothetical protein